MGVTENCVILMAIILSGYILVPMGITGNATNIAEKKQNAKLV